MEDISNESDLAHNLVFHIENPCSVIVEGKEVNIRHVYLDYATTVLPQFKNPLLKEGLRKLIDFYQKDI